MSKKVLILPFSILSLFIFLLLSCSLHVDGLNEDVSNSGILVEREHRRSLIVTEYGEISAIDITDGIRGPYHIQFITLEPNALFLPVLLHADMVFYVHSGSGRLSWADEDDTRRLNVKRGDIYRLQPGCIFHIQSNLEPERQKLRVYAIFTNTDEDLYEPSIGAYSSISNLIRGFDKKILQSAFKVTEELIEEIINTTKPPAIVHAVPGTKRNFWELETRFLKAFFGSRVNIMYGINGKKKKTRTFNILEADPDFENCNGWSLTVNRRHLHSLKGSSIGVFMVNLTKGSMMGPHWNPMATEISIVLQGQGMVRVVCSSSENESQCKNKRFRVEEGDVFAIPRFHPMAQMSFNNDSLVFMGFSTTTKRNHPQFIAGKSSVLQTLDKQVLAMSFNVSNTTIDQLLPSQADSIILDCTSCAEEEETIMEEEIEKKREEEEAREREEEEAREREEEEEREREEEEARKREEEEARKREEEEEERRREEEKAKKREEEEARKREEEKEEEERREEEREEREKQEQEEEEERRKEEEREQEEARKQEEERQKREREEREEARRQEEERQKREREEREEEAESEEEMAKRQEEERQRREREEEKRRQEEAMREEQEEAMRRVKQRERKERQQEQEAGKEREGQGKEVRREEEEEMEGGGGEEGRRVLNRM